MNVSRIFSKFFYAFVLLTLAMISTSCAGSKSKADATAEGAITAIKPGELWLDNTGKHVNAHGGGMLFHEGTYYWFGEHKTEGRGGNTSLVGASCYSSKDLMNWKNEGIALQVVEDTTSEITRGSVIERPKVIYNEKTKTFVMWFHLELKGQGYAAARTGLATSKTATGPYTYIRSFRPNAGVAPMNEEIDFEAPEKEGLQWWTPEWREEVAKGLFVKRAFEEGQMSRDMTLFVDEDGTAYHIHSAEENLTLHISELTPDYLDFTGRYVRVFPGGHNEAPAILKRNGKYYMITSGCTGWDPNAARSAVADSMFGPWEHLGNPCRGEGAELTFHSQSTYILPVQGKKDQFIFMADRWTPKNPIDGRYIWLPIKFEDDKPVIDYYDSWDLSIFED